MPEKEWTVPLGESALILRRTTKGGEVLSFSAVLVAFLSGKWHCVTRYDTAHGYAHRDVLGLTKGLRGKLRMPMVNYKQAFKYALRDLEQNADTYIADFLAH